MNNRVLFIPGVFSKAVSFLFGPYFYDQINFLNSQGYFCDLAPLFQEQTREKTTEDLIKIIKDYRPSIIVTHSKGGIDLLDALIKKPDMAKEINKIITIQAPYYGSPIADFLTDDNIRYKTSDFAIKKIFNGTVESLEELRTDQRSAYMKTHRKVINEIINEVDYYCIASEKRRKKLVPNSFLKPTIEYMYLFHGLSSDGLVPIDSALLARSNNIIFKNLDHASAVVPKKISNFKKDNFNELLLSICNNDTNHCDERYLEEINNYVREIGGTFKKRPSRYEESFIFS